MPRSDRCARDHCESVLTKRKQIYGLTTRIKIERAWYEALFLLLLSLNFTNFTLCLRPNSASLTARYHQHCSPIPQPTTAAQLCRRRLQKTLTMDNLEANVLPMEYRQLLSQDTKAWKFSELLAKQRDRQVLLS